MKKFDSNNTKTDQGECIAVKAMEWHRSWLGAHRDQWAKAKISKPIPVKNRMNRKGPRGGLKYYAVSLTRPVG